MGGVFDKCLSAAFPSSGNIIGNAGNVIGGALSKVTGGTVGPVQVTGALRQMAYAKSDVGSTSTMATALNAAAAGNVVFSNSDLEKGVEWQLAGCLNESLAKGAGANHHGAVQVLKSTGGNLGCRRCTAVDKYG